MSKSIWKEKWFIAFFAFIILLFGWAFYRQLTPSFDPPPLPNPNGYDDVLIAAKLLHPRTGFWDEMESEELNEVVAHNMTALHLVKEALEKEFGVPVDWTRNLSTDGPDPAAIERVQRIRSMARAFQAEIKNHLEKRQLEEVIDNGIRVFELGNKCYRGGLIIDCVVGIAIQEIATNELRKIATNAPGKSQEILKKLLPKLATGETSREVTDRELKFIDYSTNGIIGWIMKLNTNQLIEPSIQGIYQAELRSIAHQRLFIIHLALQVFREQNGNWPADLSELTPEILKNVPKDPYVEAPFIYHIEGKNYRLYSVGLNKQDDGGQGDKDETDQGSDVLYNLIPTKL